jgi:hypothetical protein
LEHEAVRAGRWLYAIFYLKFNKLAAKDGFPKSGIYIAVEFLLHILLHSIKTGIYRERRFIAQKS